MRFATSLLLLGSLAACRPSPLPSAPPAARIPPSSPAELLPEDLDFVLRIDAMRIRQNPVLADLVRDVAKTQPSALLAVMQAAFREASAVWVGTRWMSDGFHGAGGVASAGAAAGAPPSRATANARPARRIALGVIDADVFERPAALRGEAALEIVMGDRGIVLATAAEADAVLRVLGSGPDEKRLEPPARGLVSFAGRSRSGAPRGEPRALGTLREIAQGLVSYAGSLEEGSGPDGAPSASIAVEASLVYESPSDAARATERGKEAAARLISAGGTGAGGTGVAGRGPSGAMTSMANSMTLTEVGSSVQVRVAVPFAWLASLH